ncbi:MAG TPA: protein kinase [Pyrinomonadaceae bacterium]
MSNERWQQVEQLYHATLEKSVEERNSFLAEASQGDEDLRREVESLLAYQEQAENFIESPAVEVAARMIAEQQRPGVVPGQTINQYRITSRLGVGGMGEVYLAEDQRLSRKVALKFLPTHLTQDERHLRRFEVEARTVAALSHPNVCVIHEVVETAEGRHCIVMEYVDGITLGSHIAKGKLGVAEALDVAIEVASALSAAQAHGIVHRDIKPDNIMLRSDGYVKVLDFGLAKLTEHEASVDPDAATRMFHTSPGIVMGTVSYMSPEQARGLPVDARTDVWSLGVVLYEMLSGQKPFEGATPTDVIISIVGQEPAPVTSHTAEVPSELERIVTKALVKDRAGRYQTADDFLTDLKKLKHELAVGVEVERQRQTVPVESNARRWLTPKWILLLTTLVIGIALITAFATGLFRRSPPVEITPINSIAVLPMKNISEPAQEYFADGMTETLIAGLAKVSALRVISRTSAMQYKASNKTLEQIARELNVDAVVEGSVQRVGERVKINVRLIDIRSGQTLLSQDYDRDLRNILMLQSEVAQDVTQRIHVALTPQEQTRLAVANPINPEAYDYLLRGRFYLNRQTMADNQTAIEMFDRSVAIDPNFALAQAELAQACVWRFFLFTPDEKQWEEKAFVAVQKALSLDKDLAEAHLARGRLLWTPSNHFPHDEAIQEYRRALELNPNLDEARNQLALVYGHVGLLDEALQELDKAVAVNPSNTLARYRIGETNLFQGNYEQALKVLQSVPKEANPSLVGHQIVWALFNLGKNDEAAATLEQFLKDYPEDNRGLFTSLQAVFAASAGQPDIAEAKIKRAIERGKGFGHFHHTAYHIACAYALMNNVEESMKWLEMTANDGMPCYPLFEHDKNLNNLRKDPRFNTFLARLKEQWEQRRAKASGKQA